MTYLHWVKFTSHSRIEFRLFFALTHTHTSNSSTVGNPNTLILLTAHMLLLHSIAIIYCSIGSVVESFVTPLHAVRSPSYHNFISAFAVDSSQDYNGEDNDVEVTSDEPSSPDNKRRKLLLSAPVALPFLLGSHDNASAASTIELEKINIQPPITSPSSSQQVNTAIRAPNVICADSAEENRIAIFERVAPSVVYIDTFSQKTDVFSTNVLDVPLGSGSGFIWDTEGHIVTNFHVIQEAKSAQVAILTSGTSNSIIPAYTSARPGALGAKGSPQLKDFTRNVYNAKVVGIDPTKDIAVLKVEDVPIRELRPIEVGTSTGLRVGQGALAIGNPFGLDHTLTTGVISGIGREVKSPIGRPISNVIQTDAAINPGKLYQITIKHFCMFFYIDLLTL